jgi:hypothetical protein
MVGIMSSHGPKSRQRYADPQGYERQQFPVAHIRFEVADHRENGCTFALMVGDPITAQDRRPLFSGHIEPGMGTQLRRLAHHINDLEAKMAAEKKRKLKEGSNG